MYAFIFYPYRSVKTYSVFKIIQYSDVLFNTQFRTQMQIYNLLYFRATLITMKN